MRVGLIIDPPDAGWIGGTIYLQNVLRSLCLSDYGAEIFVFCQSGQLDSILFEPGCHRVSVIETGTSRLSAAAGRINQLRSMLNNKIDVLFGSLSRLPWSPVPWIGWIPDFQHLHMPEMFTSAELKRRDSIYRRIVTRSTQMILSSRNALEDYKRFIPQYASKATVVPFVSLFPSTFYGFDPEETVRKYHIPRPFAVVPNQWWAHKNHTVLIEAAGIFKQRGRNLNYVLTGAVADNRNFSYSSMLLQLIAKTKVHNEMIPLGLLPRWEQVQLQRAADFIIQPSLFEGWSTVVEDAKTLGQRLIVSDIAVHREQDPPSSVFFDPHSPESLADAIMLMLDASGPARHPEEDAAQAAIARSKLFAGEFLAVCQTAAGRRI